MITILFDSNIFDEFFDKSLEDKNCHIKYRILECKNKGFLKVIHTSVQTHENEESKENTRLKLKELRESLSEEVLVYGLVNPDGHSLKLPFRCTNVRVDESALKIAKKTNPNKIKTSIDDAATFNTAKLENAIFVSVDERARNNARFHGVKSLSFEGLDLILKLLINL